MLVYKKKKKKTRKKERHDINRKVSIVDQWIYITGILLTGKFLLLISEYILQEYC